MDDKKLELTEDQLEEASGGEEQPLPVTLVFFKRCVANPDHVYPEIRVACPICGCREFTCY